MSQTSHGVSNHWQGCQWFETPVLVQKLGLANNQYIIKSPHNANVIVSLWGECIGNGQVDSPHEGPSIQKASPCSDVAVIHYDDVIMTMLASQITSLMVVYSIVYLGVNQRKHQSSASLAFVRGIHRGPVNFPHKWPVTRKMFPFDDVIMCNSDWWIRPFLENNIGHMHACGP